MATAEGPNSPGRIEKQTGCAEPSGLKGLDILEQLKVLGIAITRERGEGPAELNRRMIMARNDAVMEVDPCIPNTCGIHFNHCFVQTSPIPLYDISRKIAALKRVLPAAEDGSAYQFPESAEPSSGQAQGGGQGSCAQVHCHAPPCK